MNPEDLFISANSVWWGYHTEKRLLVAEAKTDVEKKEALKKGEELQKTRVLEKLRQYQNDLPRLVAWLDDEIVWSEVQLDKIRDRLADMKRIRTISTKLMQGEYQDD